MEFAPAELSYLLANESIPSILVAQNGTLWLGTWNSGLFRKTGAKLEQFHLGHPDDDPILALCDDQNGGLWIGTYQNGLKHFKDGVISPCQSTRSSPSGSITTLARDAQGNLWVGTGGNGLYQLLDGQFRQISTRDGLASDFIRALFSDHLGTLWVGTSAGLSLIRNGRVVSLTTQDGLWDDTISQILEDDQGRLWFGSNRGIFRISREELKRLVNGESTRVMPVVYGKAEGMESLECTGGFCPAGLKTRDGRLWFSTIKGLVIVDPKIISSNSVPPAPEIEELRVDGKPIACPNGSSRSQTKSSISNFTIGPGARRVELRYTALSFTAPEKVQFRYRLDPLDANWVEAGGRRVAEYPYLPPAQYRFRVMACNEDNVWSEREAVLALTCQPAFWQTWWFKTLVGLTLTSGVGWGIKMVATRRLKRRLEVLHQQQALEKERVRIARDIHDELGALLTGISMLSDRAQAHQERGETVREQLQSISDNARSAVQSMDGIVWAINPQNDTLDNLANYLVQFAENFFQLTAIRCRLDVPDIVSPIPLSAQQRHHILLAVKEACNNAARHSGATEVWLRMRTDTSSFSISIEDNGRGFVAGRAGDGSDGLRNIAERLAEIGGRMELASEPEQGTCVKLIVSLNILHLSK
ncbi:MAG TPA: two-component regulator propeller domain-containing protein [Verrucomicrobiae bacterium]|nr:two-component regulator propeller domain-containing protein [Verrucomicrobiae bacterium]